MIARFDLDFELGRNARPALMTLAGVVMFSFMPLAIAYAGQDGPFFFLLSWRVGLGFGVGLFLAWRYRELFLNADVWRTAFKPGRRWMIALVLIGYTDILLFTLASTRIDISVATILYELNPIIFVFFLIWLYRKDGRYRRITLMNVLSFWLALIGVVLVISAQEDGFSGLVDAARNLRADGLGNTLAGVGLGVGSAVVIAFSAYSFKWGSEFASEIKSRGRSRRDMEFFGLMFCVFISNALSSPLLLGGMLFTGEIPRLFNGGDTHLAAHLIAASGFCWGLFGHVAATMLRYLSLQLTTNLGINVIRYLLPLLALCWLFIADRFWDAELVGEIDSLTLLLGMGVIIAANLGIFIDDAQYEKDETFKPLNAGEILRGGETELVEFKSHLWESRPDTKKGGRFNWRQRDAIARSVCGMLNAAGGVVAIGVSDDGKAVGIGGEDAISADRHTLYIMNMIKAKMGAGAARRVRVEYLKYQGKRLCFVRVARGAAPAFIDEEGGERFYLRSGPQVSSLSMSEASEYIKERF